MKSLIVYSSLTGNTEKVATAISQVLPEAHFCRVDDAPDNKDFDVIIIGYWVDKGLPDTKILNYIPTIQNKKVVLFGTLGAYPHSDHAKDCMAKAKALVEEQEGNEVIDSFICMGKVDPKLLERMAQMTNNAHPMTEERRLRIEEGNKHPNEEDFKNVQEFIKSCMAKLS